MMYCVMYMYLLGSSRDLLSVVTFRLLCSKLIDSSSEELKSPLEKCIKLMHGICEL